MSWRSMSSGGEDRYLLVVAGPLVGRCLTVDDGVVLGRGVEADVCLPDAKMSRRHARFRRRRGSLVVEDLDSHNGVMVNGQRSRRSKLRLGDQIRLGSTEFRVVDRPPEEEPDTVTGTGPSRVLTLLDFTASTLERMATQELLAAIGVPPTGEYEPHEVDLDADSLRTVWRNFAVVYNVSRALEQSRSTSDLLATATALIFKVIDADRCYMLLVDAETGELTPRLARGRETGSADIPLKLSRTLFERVLAEKVAVVSGDAMADSDLGRRRSVRDFQLRSVMCVPVLQDGAVSGVIQLERDRPDTFIRKDVELVTIVASLLGLKVQNVALVERQAETIGQLRQLQSELVAKERLAVLGRLASGLAHEVRNLLTPLPMAGGFLAGYRDDPELLEVAGLLDETFRRVGVLLSEVRALARGERAPIDLEEHDLAETIAHAVRFAQLDAALRRQSIGIEIEGALAPVVYDEGRLTQVLLNLIQNAHQAMPEGGRITLRATRVNEPEPAVRVAVSDTGPGMSADVLARIWEPFFTTKSGGLGLGLQISRTIVEGHGGTMTCTSCVGEGTTVAFVLPQRAVVA